MSKGLGQNESGNGNISRQNHIQVEPIHSTKPIQIEPIHSVEPVFDAKNISGT